MNVLDLVREDLRGFTGYGSARSERLQGDLWLNANESAWPSVAVEAADCRRYPEPQPPELCEALARLYGCRPEQLLVGRGSDEAIDLLVRALCVPGRDAVAVTPPVFGMYAVSARLQGAPLLELPLVDGDAGFAPDLDALADATLSGGAKLVFLCSPGNPTGNAVAPDGIAALARRLEGRALLVVDEAYGEFSSQSSAIELVPAHANLAVLRTLSKAHALAGARIGALVADPALVSVLRRCQAPYPVPASCVDIALAALEPAVLEQTAARIEIVRGERERLRAALAVLPGVRRVYPSQGNFLLLRFTDASRAFAALLEAGIVVRDQRAAPQLGDALRITVGTPAQNDRVLDVLSIACRAEAAA